ncbi:methyltransferase [Micromonospora zhanjiangensis]
MFGMIAGFWVSRAIHAVAALEIPDLLDGSPATADQLAGKTGTQAPALYRLLRAVASVGLLTEDDKNAFTLTPLGATLRKDAPDSLHAFAVTELGGGHYRAWGDLLHSIRTGEIAFDHVHNMSIWEYFFVHNQADGQVFNKSMTELTGTVAAEVVSQYDFTPYRVIVDVGGGQGAFLSAVLRSHPNGSGVLFDAPSVIAGAAANLKAAGVADRCRTEAGSFFDSVPTGGDLYLLKWVIHDWDDADSGVILRNVRAAMTPGSRLLIVDTVVPTGDTPSPSKFIDLDMMIANGGRERTAAEFDKLVGTAGFRLERIIGTNSPSGIVECVAVD